MMTEGPYQYQLRAAAADSSGKLASRQFWFFSFSDAVDEPQLRLYQHQCVRPTVSAAAAAAATTDSLSLSTYPYPYLTGHPYHVQDDVLFTGQSEHRLYRIIRCTHMYTYIYKYI